jgi:uncharacterized protein YbjT (DUF2867 family)
MSQPKKVLVIGGHGRVALRALPLLVEAGHDVSALIRKPEYEPDIRAAGATPVGAEMLAFDGRAWEELFRGFDVVVWAAGNGGRQGSDQTYAIDRDAAVASMDAAARLAHPPRYVMVSFATSLTREYGPQEQLHHYATAKRDADLHLQSSGLDHVILGPGRLTDDNEVRGIRRVDPSTEEAGNTSRQLVAEVIAHVVGAEELPADRFIAFEDGAEPVADLR